MELLRVGRAAEAVARAARAVARSPQAWDVWQFLGAARLRSGDAAGARDALERVVSGEPDNAGAWDLLGLARRQLGDPAAAAEAFARSVDLAPQVAGPWANAAANAVRMRRHVDALAFSGRALAIDPQLLPALLARADASLALGRLNDAAQTLERILAAAPDHGRAQLQYGTALARLRRYDAALKVLERVVAQHPQLAQAHSQLAAVRYRVGDTVRAVDGYREALRLAPQNPAIWSAYLFALSHGEAWSDDEVFAAHLEFGERFESPWRERWGNWPNTREPERRLRVGFVSGDLRQHAVAWMIEPVWAALDRAQFELFAYHTHPLEDAVSARLHGRVDHWRRVSELDDDALEACIRADTIDILFDLSGHTDYNRLTVFARKPAPLQLSWIGYPGTTGLKAIDYRLASACGTEQRFDPGGYTEHFVWMDDRVPFEPGAALPEVTSLPALGNGHLTFGSFNRSSKITAQTLALWRRVLCELPTACMLIGDCDDPTVRARIAAAFSEVGIEASRIDYRPRLELSDYLAMHGEVDILLDTVPYAGGTTTSYGLWMGVPTLTLDVPGPVPSHGVYRLNGSGLGDWVARDEDDYVRLAGAQARDLQALAVLRAGLRSRMEAERAYALSNDVRGRALRVIWQRWCEGTPAGPIDLKDARS